MVSGELTCEREGSGQRNKVMMNLPFLLTLLTTLLLSSQAAEDSPAPVTLEDNFILVEDYDGDEDEFSGSGDEFCSESSGGSGEEEESQAYSLQSAIYAMTTGGEVGLDIEITLQRMSDSSVEMLCKMKESSAQVSVEGSGEGFDSLDNFPATIFLIRDLAVCADLKTAVGNDITTSALKLVDVSGPGEDVERLGVSWSEVSQTNCMAILRAGPETASTEDAVVVESRLTGPARPRCERKKKNILQVAAPSRVFTSLNLASFALVSVGVTGETSQTKVPIQPPSLFRGFHRSRSRPCCAEFHQQQQQQQQQPRG